MWCVLQTQTRWQFADGKLLLAIGQAAVFFTMLLKIYNLKCIHNKIQKGNKMGAVGNFYSFFTQYMLKSNLYSM